LDVAHPGEVGEDVDLGVAPCRALDLAVDRPTLWIVQRHGADQRELQAGYLVLDESIGGDDAERVLPGIEAADLRDQGTVHVDADPLEQATSKVAVELDVLRALGVD